MLKTFATDEIGDTPNAPCFVTATPNAENNVLITGGRVFDNKNIPLRSRFGNKFTKIIFRLFSGVKINDTQTGLRGIPASLLPDLIKLKTTGYDFELDMLIFAKEKH